MNFQQINPTMRGLLLCGVVLFQLVAAQIDAQRSTSLWQTLNGDAPLVIARGGFSGIFPDSSLAAYGLATQKSLAGVVLWCDVQLTKDEVGICFPDLNLANASTISALYPNSSNTYTLNGVPTEGWFTIDFSMRDLTDVYLIQGIASRSSIYNANNYTVSTVENVAKQMMKPEGFWLNVQNDAFYEQHNLNMSSFLLSVSKTVVINFISSPEVKFLEKIASRFGRNGPIFVLRFLGKEDIEPTTQQTYGSILSNLTFVKTFASGILVPKSYIWPVDDKQYLLPHTSLVQDAHKAGLQVYVSGFANDIDIAYNYNYDPVTEYLSFVDNGNFSVDGVLSDFPMTPSVSIDCLSHIGINDTKQVDFLVITKDGASGDYPGCTDLAYKKAIKDGADVIDCSVQISSDGIPFCLSSIDLKNSTMVAQTPLLNRTSTVPEISSVAGIYSFSLTWSEIRDLTPTIVDRFRNNYNIFRNPKERNSGKLILLSEFLNLAKNSTSLSTVLISVENVPYLREKQGLDMIKSVFDTLTETGYSNGTIAIKVLIMSTDSSVLVEFKKQSKYDTAYKIEEIISDILDYGIDDIKLFANAVVIKKSSVFHLNDDGFLTGQTNVVKKLQKYQLPVYVEVFRNEYVSQAFDFFSDATVQINSYVFKAGINGTITDFPFTAARYKRNRCLGFKKIPPYMSAVRPGDLLRAVDHVALPPALPPNQVITDVDVIESPLPPVKAKGSPPSLVIPSTNAQAPRGQTRLTLSLFLSLFLVSLLL